MEEVLEYLLAELNEITDKLQNIKTEGHELYVRGFEDGKKIARKMIEKLKKELK